VRSVTDSYRRALLHLVRIIGWLFIVVSVVFLPLMVMELMGVSHFGYPWWSIVLPVIQILAGYSVQRMAQSALRDG
jgi:hypothetical protein